MDGKYDIFISYSHIDADIANKIYAYLSDAGLECFIDRKGIKDGATWAKTLAESLNNSRLMLAIFSKAFNDSDQTDNEVSIAAEKKIPILVFRITEDGFTGLKEYHLTKTNWIQAFPSPELYLERLLNSIKVMIGIDTGDEKSADIGSYNIFTDESLVKGYNAERCNDLTKAAYYFAKAAMKGIPEAEYKMGMAYYYGHGVPQSWSKSREFLHRAAESCHPGALEKLARIYHFGVGVEVDRMKALKLYVDAADKGSGLAMKALGKAFMTGELGVTDIDRSKDYYSKAFSRLYEMAVEYDDCECQFELANCYLDAEGTDYDSNEAIRWYEKAGDSGYAPAINALGICYCRGMAVHKNLVEGYRLQLKAAQMNCRIAQWNTAYNYLNGCGVDVNVEEGYNWMMVAAKGGIAPAQCALGRYYLQGKNGVCKDIRQAKKWLLKAIESGSLDAMYLLGHAYMNDEIMCDTGEETYFDLFKKAALNGHTPSYISLGKIYDDHGCEFYNPAEAVRWYEKILEIFSFMRENGESHFVSSNGAGGVMFKDFTLKYKQLFYEVLIRLSQMYREGIGKEADPVKADEITELAKEI
jgi:TPR repeat protein